LAVKYDVAVAGLGAMGSAAARQLAMRGAKVVAFDRFEPPHALGSSHGATRVTRLAIGEGDHLTPLAVRSHELWRELGAESGAALLNECGLLIVSSDANAAQTHVSGFFDNTVAAAGRFGIAHELLDAAQIRARWPMFRVRDGEHGYFENTGGFVRPEACVRAQLESARRHGAELRTNERVLGFDAGTHGVTVTTGKGSYATERLIVAAGPWLPELLPPSLAALFKIYRQIQVWLEVEDAAAFAPQRFPVFIWELQNSTRGIYGFPALAGEHAIKLASEEFLSVTTPAAMDRDVHVEEIAAVQALATANIGGIGARCVRGAACLYTVTRDFGFVIDRHPDSERVIIASPCSGHGFKHSPAIGEALADMAVGRAPRFNLAPFAFARFAR